ncbi:MAG: hypothetical protein AB9891_14595 [Anaerolineaceae bacterium]
MSRLIKYFRFEYLLILMVLFTALYSAFTPPSSLLNWYSSDDAFYYFKTAQNITEGHGVTFDGLGRDSGFHPLWMLICIPIFALARFDLILPLRILVLVSGVINAAAAVILYHLLARHLSKEAAAIASLLWATLPHIQSVTAQMGMESTINALCVLLLINLLSKYAREPGSENVSVTNLLSLGLAAALVLLSRLDNLFLVTMAGLWFIFRHSRLRYLVPSIVSLTIISVIAAYYIRLEPGAEYYQYSDSVYFMIAAALVIRLPLFYLFRQFQTPPSFASRTRNLKGLIIEVLNWLAPVILSSSLLALFMFGLQAAGFINGFPRMVLIYDGLITLTGLLLIRLLHILSLKGEADPLPTDWKKWLSDGALFAAPIAVLLVVYVIWNFFYFGTPLPVSGQIKHWWGSLPNPIYGRPADNIKTFFGFPEQGNGPWSLVLQLVGNPLEAYAEKNGTPETDFNLILAGRAIWGVLTALVLALIAASWRLIRENAGKLAIFPLFTGCLLQIVSYFGTGYINTRPWYWVIEMVLIILFAALMVEALLAMVRPMMRNPILIPAVIGLAGLALFVRYNSEIIEYLPMTVEPGKEEVYLWGAHGLEEATEPGALIGSTGGGVIAYFIQDRVIINLDGLMNSNEYFERLQNGTAYEYLDRIGLDYVYGSKYMLTDSDPYMGLFGGRIEFEEDIFGSGLYRYLPGR